MLRLDLSPGDVLTRGAIQYVLRARTDQFLDFVGLLSSEPFQITDKQLAVEIGRGAAAINRQDPALAVPSSASLAAFSMHSAQEKDEARKRLAYVLSAREHQTGGRLSEADLSASIIATARRLADQKPPCTRLYGDGSSAVAPRPLRCIWSPSTPAKETAHRAFTTT